MSRRPSIIGSLTAPQPEAPPAAAPAPPKPKGSAAVHTSLYVDAGTFERLREIAFVQRRKVHDVVLDGIDMVLEKHGHPPAERRKRGPKAL